MNLYTKVVQLKDGWTGQVVAVFGGDQLQRDAYSNVVVVWEDPWGPFETAEDALGRANEAHKQAILKLFKEIHINV